MDLNPATKAHIDSKSLEQLLAYVRFAPAGDSWMTGETGGYWLTRLRDLRAVDNEAFVHASKRIGWDEKINQNN